MSVFCIERIADGHRLPPALDDDGTESFLAWPTRKQAEIGLRFQVDQGYLEEEELAGWRILELP